MNTCSRGRRSIRTDRTPGRLLGSIPTAPTNHLPDWSGLNKFTRGQKGADKAIDPVPVR